MASGTGETVTDHPDHTPRGALLLHQGRTAEGIASGERGQHAEWAQIARPAPGIEQRRRSREGLGSLFRIPAVPGEVDQSPTLPGPLDPIFGHAQQAGGKAEKPPSARRRFDRAKVKSASTGVIVSSRSWP